MSIMHPRQPRGFALIAAIVLLVLLAALGAFVASVVSMQFSGAALDTMGARAYQAARSGTEWGLAQALNNNSCIASSNIGLVDTMTVTVTCTIVASGNAVEAGLGTIYSITSTACNIPAGSACPGPAASAHYVERSLTVLAEN